MTGVANGPSNIASKKIYATKAGTSTPYYLATTISDNTTTTANFSQADAGLTPQATTAVANGITFSDPT